MSSIFYKERIIKKILREADKYKFNVDKGLNK